MKSTVAAFVGALTVSVALGVSIAAQSPKSQWDGAYTEAQATRGEALYTDYCAVCHGPDLGGGEMAPPLIGGAFQANWNELPLAELFERIRTSMPQNAPGTLSRRQTADVLAYVLAKGGYPAGKTELPPESEELADTKFLAMKP